MKKPQRIRNVNPQTMGGGWTLKDLFLIPIPFWIIFRLIQASFRYKFAAITLLIILYTLIAKAYGLWTF